MSDHVAALTEHRIKDIFARAKVDIDEQLPDDVSRKTRGVITRRLVRAEKEMLASFNADRTIMLRQERERNRKSRAGYRRPEPAVSPPKKSRAQRGKPLNDKGKEELSEDEQEEEEEEEWEDENKDEANKTHKRTRGEEKEAEGEELQKAAAAVEKDVDRAKTPAPARAKKQRSKDKGKKPPLDIGVYLHNLRSECEAQGKEALLEPLPQDRGVGTGASYTAELLDYAHTVRRPTSRGEVVEDIALGVAAQTGIKIRGKSWRDLDKEIHIGRKALLKNPASAGRARRGIVMFQLIYAHKMHRLRGLTRRHTKLVDYATEIKAYLETNPEEWAWWQGTPDEAPLFIALTKPDGSVMQWPRWEWFLMLPCPELPANTAEPVPKVTELQLEAARALANEVLFDDDDEEDVESDAPPTDESP
jgi:hypothetical protein